VLVFVSRLQSGRSETEQSGISQSSARLVSIGTQSAAMAAKQNMDRI